MQLRGVAVLLGGVIMALLCGRAASLWRRYAAARRCCADAGTAAALL